MCESRNRLHCRQSADVCGASKKVLATHGYLMTMRRLTGHCTSIVQFLEQRISELDRLHAAPDQRDGDDHEAVSTKAAADQFLKFADFSITSNMRSSMVTDQPNLLHAAKLFYPSERPPLKIPIRGIYYDVRPRTAGRAYNTQFSHLHARKIPVSVAKRLFANYRNGILPQFPCFMEEHVVACFQQIYNQPSSDATKTRLADFVVPMVLAISCLTSNNHHFSKVAALSESLQKDAMRHISLLGHSSIQALQCILLLIQHALLLPYSGNLWYLAGEAMRMAVSLGLHQEPHPSTVADPADAEFRRRLFWMVSSNALNSFETSAKNLQTYQLDRIVGISAGCPVALSDEHITTQLPYNGGGRHTDLDESLRQASPGKNARQFLVHCQVRLIQSEIHLVQFFDHPLPSDTESYDSWVQITADRIQNLASAIAADSSTPPWLTATAHQCQVLLYRPSSRNIAVSGSSLLNAVMASVKLIDSHIKLAQAGGLILTFEMANSSFQAGMVLLYALRNRANELIHSSMTTTVQKSLEALGQLFVCSYQSPQCYLV